jgi:hypothetical protein
VRIKILEKRYPVEIFLETTDMGRAKCIVRYQKAVGSFLKKPYHREGTDE